MASVASSLQIPVTYYCKAFLIHVQSGVDTQRQTALPRQSLGPLPRLLSLAIL